MLHSRKIAKALTITASFVFLTAGQTLEKPKGQPKYVRFSLAGGDLGKADSYTKFDPKQRYYLIATGDCDGASVSLILTPKPDGYGIEPDDKKSWGKFVSLPRLRTGQGVNIGETPQQVKRKLGRAPHFLSYEAGKKERIYQYRANLGNGWQYLGIYTFHNERLWAIHYNYGRSDGC